MQDKSSNGLPAGAGTGARRGTDGTGEARVRRSGAARHLLGLMTGGLNTLTIAALGAVLVSVSVAERPWSTSAQARPAEGQMATPAEFSTASLPTTTGKSIGGLLAADRPLVAATAPPQPQSQPESQSSATSASVPAPAEPRKGPKEGGVSGTSAPTPTPAHSATQATSGTTSAGSKVPAVPMRVRETAFMSAMDRLLEPSRSLTISVEDATRLRDAFTQSQNVALVRTLRDQTTHPVARKLIDWSLLRGGAGTAGDVQAFLAANPDWPNRDLLNQRAEEYHFLTGGAAKDIKAYFNAYPPRTAIGRAALASALLAEGDQAGARRLAAQAWREGHIPILLETGFIERFGKLLDEADHKFRLDRLLADDSRWVGERRERATTIRRTIAFLSEAERAKANARLAVYLRSPDANQAMAALPEDAATKPRPDWGFALQLAQWHRRGGRAAEGWKILQAAPLASAELVSPDDWWEERRISAYEALKAGQPQVAYDLVKVAGNLGVNARKDQAFVAGWIAAQLLNDRAAALRHFHDLEAAADGPLSRGKAGWWLATLYEQAGDKAAWRTHLEKAARNIDTFYGMLARQKLTGGATDFVVKLPQLPSAAEAKAFNQRDAVKALVMTRRAGLDASVSRAFMVGLRIALPSEPNQAMIAHLAEALGDTQMAVRIAKSAVARGLNLINYAYPIHPMPKYSPLRPPPETALLLGVARQESEFNVSTKSGAGATGLLQVMPVTANHVCRDYKLKCDLTRLREPAYNAMIASAYLGDRKDEFSGSYVLTLAGYNAGPGRARQWLREFGDPREPNVDPIDWIHRIPFEETRDYVLKVMSNIQVYRARLGNEATALTLATDLRRTAPPTKQRAAAN